MTYWIDIVMGKWIINRLSSPVIHFMHQRHTGISALVISIYHYTGRRQEKTTNYTLTFH